LLSLDRGICSRERFLQRHDDQLLLDMLVHILVLFRKG
jgi:hypothetical protein